MAEKSDFVDMISEATSQRSRRYEPRVIDLPGKERSRLSRPSDRLVQWRLENLTPWKIKPWKFTDWD